MIDTKTKLVKASYLDGSVVRVHIHGIAETLFLPRWAGRPGRDEFKLAVTSYPLGWYGPFESHFVCDPEFRGEGVGMMMIEYRESPQANGLADQRIN